MGLLINILIWTLISGISFYIIAYVLNWISYKYLKNRILNRQKWDLNICCGTTDGGGINADIVRHKELPNFVLIQDIYKLPFQKNQFDHVLCSHTIEHVDYPIRFHRELQRVGKTITYVIPPLWDITAAFNLLEHKHLFLAWGTEYKKLPKFIPLPAVAKIHAFLGQKIKA